MPSAINFRWNGNDLFYGKVKKPIVSIEQDRKYPGMWRVRKPDGTLTDMVNRTRAKDAALTVADRVLRLADSLREVPPVRPMGVVASKLPEKV